VDMNEEEEEALQVWNDFVLCREFGWLPRDIERLTEDEYGSFIQLISISNGKRKSTDTL